MLAYSNAFYEEESDGTATWRWASGSSHFDVFNPTAKPRLVRLTFSVRPINLASIHIVAPALRLARLTGGDVPVATTLLVSSQSRVRVSVISDGTPTAHPPDPRHVLYEVRNARLAEPSCS